MIRLEQKLLEYNRAGIVPGPEESEQAFTARASYCLNLKAHIPHMLDQDFPFSSKEIFSGNAILTTACEKAQAIYDICPSWVPLFFSNYKLPFWNGGCAWIFQHTQDSPNSAFFQLRQNFRNSTKYLGIYDRTELITHELSHVGRMLYEEPKFEEILAYRSAKSSFRRFMGPIIQSSYESMIFVLALLFLLVVDFFSMVNPSESLFHFSLIGRFIVLGLIIYALGRLCWRQKQFYSCLTNLRKVLSEPHLADAVIYRLTDKEIITFGRQSSEEIKQYAEEQKNKTLRWKVIYEAYFT